MQRKGKENKQGDTKLTRNMRDISSFKRKRKIKLIYMLTQVKEAVEKAEPNVESWNGKLQNSF